MHPRSQTTVKILILIQILITTQELENDQKVTFHRSLENK